jgi:hypothetical protein
MTTMSRRLRFARDAVESVVSALEVLPESDERQRLLRDAHACRSAIDGWADEAPTAEQHEAAMQRTLQLHIAVARLARLTRGGPPPPPGRR